MPSRKYSATDNYRYGFNGKENDNDVKGEGNQQDYGMRIYDPRLGRFLSVDPVFKKFPMLTPYQFASNSPIQAIDQDGLEAWVVIWASMSKDKDPDGQGTIGHAGIIVKNYREIKKEYWEIVPTENGGYEFINKIEKTYEPTGSYTYYDLWPKYGADLGNPLDWDTPLYQKQEFVMQKNGVNVFEESAMEKWISNNDVSALPFKLNPSSEFAGENTNEEGKSPDGILKLLIDEPTSFNLNETLNNQLLGNAQYQTRENNCASNVCKALNANGYNIKKEKNRTYIASWSQGVKPKQYFYTPNFTYNQLKELKTTQIIKDAKDATSQDYEDAVIDDEIKRRFKE